MQKNILWAGREYNSLENCLVKTSVAGSETESTIIGYYEGEIYKVDYRIHTDVEWQTLLVDLSSLANGRKTEWLLKSDGQGNWFVNGESADQFQGCIDVDIPLTPFTNTLPINRLKLQQGAEAEINVLYIDVLKQQIYPVRQKYKQLSVGEYHYQNVPNDFEATIKVDETGFVIDYPLLFVQTAILDAK